MFQPHYKLLRDEKEFEGTAFEKKLSGVPFKTFNFVYSVDDSNEKLDIFNSFFKSCLDKHAPLRRAWLNEQGRHQETSKRTECTY